MKNNNIKEMHFNIEIGLYNALEKEVKEKGKNKTEIISVAIREYLNKSNETTLVDVMNLIKECNKNSIYRDDKVLKAITNEDVREALLDEKIKNKKMIIEQNDLTIKKQNEIINGFNDRKKEVEDEIKILEKSLEEYRKKNEHNDYIDESERKKKERHKRIFIISITLNVVFIILIGLLVYLKVVGVI